MKALSIRQPWAHRILYDGKDVENRDWPTSYRGWVLIHAGKRPDDGYFNDEIRDLPRGGIVGMVEILNCVTEWPGHWFFGKYGFVLHNPRPLPFIPCKGALGFFTPDIRAEVVRMWHADELTEGQGSKILSMDHIDFRALCDASVERAEETKR